jgi:hypothetical protein
MKTIANSPAAVAHPLFVDEKRLVEITGISRRLTRYIGHWQKSFIPELDEAKFVNDDSVVWRLAGIAASHPREWVGRPNGGCLIAWGATKFRTAILESINRPADAINAEARHA